MTSRARLVVLDREGVTPYAAGLAELARPLAPEAPTAAEGDARFVLALEGERVVGALEGAYREALDEGVTVVGAQLRGFVVHPSRRGTGLARGIALHALREAFAHRGRTRWAFAWAAAVGDARGDVMRSARGLHPARLLRPAATLALYAAAPAALAALDVAACPVPPSTEGLDLSPYATLAAEGPGVVTSPHGAPGLAPADARGPLAHLCLGPRDWRPTWGAWLAACGAHLARVDADATACFALDRRLDDHVRWLAAQGLSPRATCTVYTLRLTRRGASPPWVHVATSEL